MSDPIDASSDLGAEDARSSSLSEMDDAQDDQAMTSPEPSTSRLNEGLEDDSEAETERLEQITPKPPRRATLNDGKFSSGKIASALTRELDLDTDGEGEASPSSRARDGDFDDEMDPLGSLASIATSVAEQAQRKRKRTSSDGSPLSEAIDLDEPARKRSHAQEDEDEDGETAEADGIAEDAIETAEDEPAIEDEPDSGGALPDVEDDLAARNDARIPRAAKRGKGKRKGKKVKEVDPDSALPNEEEAAAQEADADAGADAEAEAEAEVEVEEEESTNVDEECRWLASGSRQLLTGISDEEEVCHGRLDRVGEILCCLAQEVRLRNDTN